MTESFASPDQVGETPLIELDIDVDPTVYGKAEWFNQRPSQHGGGSIKTRIGKAMIEAVRASPAFDGDRTLLEASSGNTGVAVARFGAEHGFDVEIVLPDDAGEAKVDAIEAAGATTTVADSDRGYDAFVDECRRKAQSRPDEYHYLNQYDNEVNPAVHAGTTGVEIWEQTDGAVTHFVAGAGTGGTLSGVGHALRDRGVDVYGFEPASGDNDIAGLKHMHSTGNFVPETYHPDTVETMSFVPTEVAYRYVTWLFQRYDDKSPPIIDTGQWDRETVREHLRSDGDFVVGPSSGACLAMVDRLANMGVLDEADVVVVPLPDRGDRYPERSLRDARER